jgi:O-6-methylguanine DNA methyltransferase
MQTPIGWLQGESDLNAIYKLDFVDKKPKDKGDDDNPFAQKINSYFKGESTLSELPIAFEKTSEFKLKVLKACNKIPYGEVKSYSQLAKECGSPNAARAVGLIMKNNHLPLVIPCHRVVGKNGSLVGFNVGLNRKEWLLKHEKVSFSLQNRVILPLQEHNG